MPDWLKPLNKKQEHMRAHHGLYAGKDGWYKTIKLKKRYIAKPMPLEDVLIVLPGRIDEILGNVEEKPAKLATGSTTIEQLTEMFIAHLWQRHKTGQPRKLERRTYDDYVDLLGQFVECVGPNQPAIAAGPTWFTKFARLISKKAASTRRRYIIYLTAFFNWAGPGRHSLNFYRQHVNFGADLAKPDEAQLRKEMSESSTLYTPEQYFSALQKVKDCPLLFAVGLVGLNCAFLPTDITSVPDSAIDFETGIVAFPRGKNGIERKAVLMPETLRALKAYIARRPERPEGCDTLFVREDGEPFSKRRVDGPDKAAGNGNALGRYWSSATKLPFKGLRTTFATTADGLEDQRAVDLVMGHAAKTIRQKHYVKHFSPDRIRAVTEHVWLHVVSAVPLPSGASVSAVDLLRSLGVRVSGGATPRAPRAGSGTAAA